MAENTSRGHGKLPHLYYKRRRDRAVLALFHRAVSCTDGLRVDAAMSLAYLLSATGINSSNYQLFFILVRTNNMYVVDALIGDRDPASLFSGIKPHRYLIREAFQGLVQSKPREICEIALMVYLGVIQTAYKTSRFGYALYPLTVSDVYHIGKFLDEAASQRNHVNRLIVDILFDVYQMAIDDPRTDRKDVAITANRIRMAFFDNTKELHDAIPAVLLHTDKFMSGQMKPLRYIVD